MNSIKTVRTKYAFLASLRRIVFGLSVALLLLYPEISRADIENLYAENYSSSVTITNPTNAYGAPDGNTADSPEVDWGKGQEYWTFTMADTGNPTEIFQSAEFYLTHYISRLLIDDLIDLEYSPDNGLNWFQLHRYDDEFNSPPTSLTTEGPFSAPNITTWTDVNNAHFRIIGISGIKGAERFWWFVDAVELRVHYQIGAKLTITGTGIAPATVNAGDQNVGMERIVLDPGADTITVTSITVTRTGTGQSSDVGAVSLFDDSGSTPGSFDAGDVEVPGASGMFVGTTVTLTPTTSITLSGASETYYFVYDIPADAVNDRTLGAQINSGADVDCDAGIVLAGGGGFPEPPVEDNATIQGGVPPKTLTVTGTFIGPATIDNGTQDVGMVKLVLDPNGDTMFVYGLTVTRTGSALEFDLDTVSLYDDSGTTPGGFDAGDSEVPGASGTFWGGTLTLNPTTTITLSGFPETYYIVYDIDINAIDGRTLGGEISSAEDVNTDADVNVEPGGGGWPQPLGGSSTVFVGVYSALTVYGEAAVPTPRYRTWDGTSWSGEDNTSDIGGKTRWAVQRSCPTKDEYILGVLDTDGHVNVQIWDGASWGAPLEVTTVIEGSNTAYRGFDIAYEQVSGDAVVVYHTGGNDPEYRIWDGISWSGSTVIDLPTVDVPVWIKMVPDASGSDEIILVALDKSNTVTAAVWDGSSWGNAISLEADAFSFKYEGIGAAYEYGSGRAMVGWGTSTSPVIQYRFWDGASWSGESEVSTVGTEMQWLELASDASSDRVILGALCDGANIEVNIWDGTGWGTQLRVENDAEAVASRCFDVAWERSGDQAMVCWGKSGSDLVSYRTYQGGAWSSAQDGPDMGSTIEILQLTPDPQTDQIFMGTVTRDKDLQLTRWSGASWETPDEPETTVADNKYEPFMLTYPGGLVWPTAVKMKAFQAHAYERSILLEWTTAHEIDNAGFHLYRSLSRQGPYTRITRFLIPGQGYSTRGARYRFLDEGVETEVTYYYKLEDVDFHGHGTFHGPVWATPGGDRDGDGMPDPWEEQMGLDPDVDDSMLDYDGDGLSNLEEFFYGLNPFDSDTDGDGVPDGLEIENGESDGKTGEKGDEDKTEGDGVRIIESDASGITVELVTSGIATETEVVEGREYQKISIPGYSHGFGLEVGFPQVPVKGFLLECPEKVDFTVTVLESNEETFAGYSIYPVPRYQAQGGEKGSRYLTEQFTQDEGAYSADRRYPGPLAEVGDSGYLRDQRVVQLKFYPIQFNPATGTVKLHKKIRVRVNFYNSGMAQLSSQAPIKGYTLSFDGPAYKISINETGIYRLSYDYLASNAPELLSEPSSTLKLFNRDKEVALRVVEGDFIEFYAMAEDTRYTDTDVYWLTAGESAGKRMEEIQSGVPSPMRPDSFWSVAHFEENEDYWGSVPGDEHVDRWFYRAYIGGRNPYVREYRLNLKGVTATDDPATLRVSLFGMADLEPHPNHHTRISINGHMVDDFFWDGQREFLTEIQFPRSYLLEGQNILTVEALLDTGAEWDWILPNWFEVGYWRSFDASGGDQLEFSYGIPGEYEFHVDGFTSDVIEVFDITDTEDPKRIVGLDITDTNPYTVTFENLVTSSKRYLALTEGKIRTQPHGIEWFESRNLRSPTNGADWIAICYGDFSDAVRPLAQYRAEQGLRVMVVTTRQLYDEFNHGISSPHGIKEFLRYAFENWQSPAPKYVLLVGDGTYDYRGYYGQEFSNFVPSYLTHTQYAGEVPDDHWYGCVHGDDLLSDLYVGRLPARTAQEVGTMVDKILAYETSGMSEEGWEKKVLLVADDDEADFKAMNEACANSLSSAYIVTKKYLEEYADPSDLHGELVDGINEGALLINYVGHGAEDFWADEEILGAWDVDALDNGPKYPLVVAMTCLNGYFIEAFQGWDSLAEVLMKSSDKGSMAVFTSTGMTIPEEQALLDGGLFEGLFEKGKKRLGEAISHGKLDLLANSGGGEDVVRSFMLFGDPAMEMKVQPGGSTVSSAGSESGGGCFIATAAYGSYADGHVMALKALRDQYLLPHSLGRSLVHLYYQYSPPLAKFIHQRGHLRSITRMGLSPLVGASRVFARVSLAERWPLLITIAVILSVLVYMELLIRRYRRPRTKPVHPENVSDFSSKLRPGTRKSSGNSENG
ncbi:MAG: hypothetical protein A7315_01820 [Candidatus Altiarchaeales archaeon WOR_SM1_79]|nr:MAG: hypothetical protein A7315_01820 [Candidatus Altiarchaeales archaeon WOR_SM1_79]